MNKIIGLLASSIVALMGWAVVASAAGNNLIANPSVETASGSAPASWGTAKHGNNTTSFNYLNTGHTGSRSLQVQMTKHEGGQNSQAEWAFAPAAVNGNTKYTFTDWYQSNVESHYSVMVTKSGGNTTDLTDASLKTSAAWKQGSISFTTPKNAVSLTVYHYINKVGQLTSDDYDLEGPGAVVVAPTVSISAPANNASVAGIQTVTATAAGGSSTVKNVQFKLDGANLGAAVTASPYSVSWNTAGVSNGSHTLSAVVTSASNLTATSANVNVTVNNPTAPTVSITAPSANATVSATRAVTASASGNTAIKNVQFKLDGANLGNPVTTAPYTYNWDTTKTTNGTHSLTAVATNTANLTATSAAVSVNVQNQTVTPPTPGNGPNLVLNSSVEDSATGTTPNNWLSSNWGTNTSTFSYLNTGHTGNHSLEVQTTAWTNGAANWYYANLPITATTTYQYSNWYKSNVDTEVDAQVTMADGTTSYYFLGTVLANTNWTKFTTTFTPPAGAKSMAVYQILAKVGYIISDDYSLNTYTPVPFNRGIVSVSLDDGWLNQYQNALPVLQQNGIPATFNIITDSSITNPDPEYMNLTQIKTLLSGGNEIASHSETHPDLTTLSQSQIVQEMGQSQSILQNALGVSVPDFAYPFGAYNANTLAVGSQYYQTQRTVNAGYNTKDNLNLTQLKIYEVDSNISQAQVQGWINGAIAQKSWLILVYHEIAVTPTDPTDALYDTQPSDFTAEMAYLHNTGVATETVHQAVNEILSQ